MTDAHADLAVVGGGPGGYAAAIRAAQHGVDATLVERSAFGGVCLNTGCIPSKALVSAADLVHRAGSAEHMGVHADPEVDVAQLASWRDDVVVGMSAGVEKLCRANGVTLREGTARFVDDETIAVESGSGGDADSSADPETLTFDAAIVAVGSRAVELSGLPFADDRVLAAADVLSLEELPDRLVVGGAGYVGMELATALAKLGTEVVVLEALDAVLPGFDADLVRPVRQRAGELGVDIHTGHAVEGFREAEDGVVVTATVEGTGSDAGDGDGTSETRAFASDAVLVAVGREPAADRVDPGAAGLEVDERGFLQTDGVGATPVEGIYAVGDVAGEPMLAHAASHEGTRAAAAVAAELGVLEEFPGADASDGIGAVPAAAFTDPEIATVGMDPDEAAAAGHEPAVGEFPFRASGRALTADETAGTCRVVADADTGRVLGGQVVGPEASELIAEITLAVESGATLAEVAETVHAHPTLAEAVMEAAANARGQAIHTLNR